MANLPSLDAAFAARVAKAAEAGRVLRYVGIIDHGRCQVKITEADGNDPLYKVKTAKTPRRFIPATISQSRWYCAVTARGMM